MARNGLPNSSVASLCSDPAVITPWYDLVQNTKRKYGLLDGDTYNFDETGFTMGVVGNGGCFDERCRLLQRVAHLRRHLLYCLKH
jgi:hypothetical protein